MNTTLKHWKEAATVILAAGTERRRAVAALWRETSGSFSQSQRLPAKSAFDYEVLLLKRSPSSGFMPGAYVFPGGIVEPVDFSAQWLDVYKDFRHLANFGVGVVKQPIETRPPIFATERIKFGSPIPGDVGLRICAIRETFEESGVLLVIPTDEARALVTERNTLNRLSRLSHRWDKILISEWRSLVMENSSNFIKMCKELECLPNIWALQEWGNWLTPVSTSPKQRRYDTAFYMCCLEELPDTLQDQKEIVQHKWFSPSEILHSYRNKEFWIPAPQCYELGRMCHFTLLSDLHNFARQRSRDGCEQWLPVLLNATDGIIVLLPGDDVFTQATPDSVKSSSTGTVEKSLEQLQKETKSSNMHRIVIQRLYNSLVYMNIKPRYKHLVPLNSMEGPQDALSGYSSKL